MYPAFQRRGGEAQLATLAGAVPDWDAWLAEVRAQGLAVAVWRAVRDSGIQQILPEHIGTALEELLRETVEKLGAFEGVISAVAVPLGHAKIEWALLAAPSASCAAGNAQQRPAFRILVRPEALPRTGSSLLDAGWDRAGDRSPLSRCRDTEHLTHSRHAGCSLFVQSGLLPWVRLPEEEAVWAALEERSVEGYRVAGLGRGAALTSSGAARRGARCRAVRETP